MRRGARRRVAIQEADSVDHIDTNRLIPKRLPHFGVSEPIGCDTPKTGLPDLLFALRISRPEKGFLTHLRLPNDDFLPANDDIAGLWEQIRESY